MESLGKTEMIVAGGAFITSIGASWYLNGRINELTESVQLTNEKLAKIIIKIGPDSNEIRNLRQSFDMLTKELTDVKNHLAEISILKTVIRKQNKAILEIQSFIVGTVDPDHKFSIKLVPDKKIKNKNKRGAGKKSGKKSKYRRKESDSDSSSESTDSESSKSDDDLLSQIASISS